MLHVRSQASVVDSGYAGQRGKGRDHADSAAATIQDERHRRRRHRGTGGRRGDGVGTEFARQGSGGLPDADCLGTSGGCNARGADTDTGRVQSRDPVADADGDALRR